MVVDIDDYIELMVVGYWVEYQVMVCNGIQMIYVIYINVVFGDLILVILRDMVLKNDVDECLCVVIGIVLLVGFECNIIIIWMVDNDVVFFFGSDDVSGIEFQVGIIIVIYIMIVDLNGDGVIEFNDFDIFCGEL